MALKLELETIRGSLMDIVCEENEHSNSGYAWHLIIYRVYGEYLNLGLVHVVYQCNRNDLILSSLATRHQHYHRRLEELKGSKERYKLKLIEVELSADGPFGKGGLEFYIGHEPLKILK